MVTTTLAATAIVCILAHLLLLMSLPASGLNCMRSDGLSQAHTRDCGPKAQGCRILMFPYRVYNHSAVGICRKNLKPGEFIYDCAVDCPTGNNKLDWNELVCCKGDNCNSNIDDVTKKNYCYVSKADLKEKDTLVVCSDNQRCALNLATKDTQCVGESECSQKEKWMCCTSKENCGSISGIHKVENIQEADSTDANNLTASIFMSVASVTAFFIAVS